MERGEYGKSYESHYQQRYTQNTSKFMNPSIYSSSKQNSAPGASLHPIQWDLNKLQKFEKDFYHVLRVKL